MAGRLTPVAEEKSGAASAASHTAVTASVSVIPVSPAILGRTRASEATESRSSPIGTPRNALLH
ncbi:hypothetical protein [Streptomyces sp. NPDC059460]|uniref:hypothetical protein n=1 Tax=Streptomyces sp. NPDC059460 TaxID=3346840 RepID=UPI00368270B6